MASDQVVEEHISGPPTDTITREWMRKLGEKTCLSIPLRFSNEPVGVLMLVEKASERHFTPEEHQLARSLGDHAAAAIHNAQLYRRLELQNQRHASLLDSSRSITSSIDYDKVLQGDQRKAAEAMDAANCLITSSTPFTACSYPGPTTTRPTPGHWAATRPVRRIRCVIGRASSR